MKNISLEHLLGTLAVPPLDEAAKAKARHRAEIAFANRGPAPQPARAGWKNRALAFSLVAMGLAFLCLSWFSAPPLSTESAADQKLLAEMESLFPGQLDGIICTNGGVALDLAPEASSTKSHPAQALALTLRRGKELIRVLGYSGRRVCIKLEGGKHSLEPLVTGDGSVIVEGDDFVWTASHPAQVAGYQIQAQTLSL